MDKYCYAPPTSFVEKNLNAKKILIKNIAKFNLNKQTEVFDVTIE